jgi:hypothetical protein
MNSDVVIGSVKSPDHGMKRRKLSSVGKRKSSRSARMRKMSSELNYAGNARKISASLNP